MNLPRPKRGGGGYKTAERNHTDFYNSTMKKLNTLMKHHNSAKKTYKNYFDPSLIFKIKLTQGVSDIYFRKELDRVKIQTLSSVPGKDGYHVVFASDEHLAKFRQKLKERIGRKDKANFVDAIGDIVEIPPVEKLGESLQEYPLQKLDMEYIDVEVWKMKDEDLEKFIPGFENLVRNNNGKITDKLLTNDFYVMRILLDQNLLDIITSLREVAHADRPATISTAKQLDVDIHDVDIKGPPPKDSPGILVVDSGILNHPLLQASIVTSVDLTKRKNRTVTETDTTGHGTQVAGIALYGDISSCINKSFDPQLWLYSAKVMYDDGTGYPTYDVEKLLEHQLKTAVEKTIAKYKNCKIINISLGNPNNKMYNRQRQFRLASLIDELSFKHKDIMFTVAAGNNNDAPPDRELDPIHMLEASPQVKIIDPATSAHALTIGASFQFRKPEKINTLPWPSVFTRVGPGLNNMIKPELVANGGGYNPDLLTINPRWLEDGRLFTYESGTSFSSPMVAHHLGVLKGKFPSDSRNMLKALVLSSAAIPRKKPSCLAKIDWGSTNDETQKILNIYGYGIPNLDNALASDTNRVLLKHDGKMPLDDVHFFTVNMPKKFFTEKGPRAIEIVLVFDPPTNSNRADYLGVSMNFRLYKELSFKTIQRLHAEGKKKDLTCLFQKKQIKMVPSYTLLHRGVHQKAIRKWSSRSRPNIYDPLVLAVTCQKKWYAQDGYEQPYAVVMTIKHKGPVDIYTPIRIRNKARVRVQGQA